MKTVHQFANIVGRKDIADALGITVGAVSKELRRDTFPPGWFLALSALCKSRDIDCPYELFNFKNPPVIKLPKVSRLSEKDRGEKSTLQAQPPQKQRGGNLHAPEKAKAAS